MWMILGVAAIVTAICNVSWTVKGKDAKWFQFASLSLTALTLCAFYSMDAQWILNEDWSALMDVTPTASKVLWGLTIISILMNSVSTFQKDSR